MAVDQAGGQCRAMGVDLCRSPLAIHIRGIAPLRDLAVNRDQTIPVGYGLFHLAGQDHPDVTDHEFCRGV